MTDWQLPAHGLFVTGTDTEVGKTWVSTQILRTFKGFSGHFPALEQREKTDSSNFQGDPLLLHARKPVASGAELIDGRLISTDTRALCAATNEPTEIVTRYQFAAPVSPSRAALEAGFDTALPNLLDACQTPEDGWTLVEGAGGFLSPLGSDGSLNADLAEALNLPVLLVAGLKLGCINHTLLTLEAIERRGLRCVGIVLNDLHDTKDHRTEKEMAGLIDRPLYQMPYGQPGSDWHAWLGSLQLVAQPDTG